MPESPAVTINTNKYTTLFKVEMMINTDRNEFHKEVYRSIKNAAILLLVCRPLRDHMMFCTFEEVWGQATAEKRHWKQLFWEAKGLDISDISLQIEKQVSLVICASCISEKLINRLLIYQRITTLVFWYFH
jgi:hypothetical protein